MIGVVKPSIVLYSSNVAVCSPVDITIDCLAREQYIGRVLQGDIV